MSRPSCLSTTGRGGDHRECGQWAWQAIYALIPAALVLGTVLFFGANLLIGFLEPDALIAPFAIDYMENGNARARVAETFATQTAAPNPSQIRRLMRMGLPVGTQWWLEMASFTLFLTLLARMGDAPMAASQAFISLLSISFMQAYGLGIGVSTLVGQYIGAKDLAAAERSFYSGMRLCLCIAGIVGLLLVFASEPLLRLYTDDPRVLALGRPLMLLGAVYQVFDALAIIADSGLRGAGDTRWPMMIRFLLSWFLFLPTAYILGIYLDGGLTWAWVGGLLYIVVLTSVLIGRFRGGRWKLIEI